MPESGVTLEDLLAANGLIKMVPEIADSTIEEAGSALEGEHKFNRSDRVIVTTSKFGHLSHINKQAFRQTYNIVDYEIRMMETSRQIILNEIILNGYTVELITSEKAYWSSLKHYYGDYAIKTDINNITIKPFVAVSFFILILYGFFLLSLLQKFQIFLL